MEQSCTCGAILPDGARFCHKCGKPQYEEDIARLRQQEAQPVRVQSSAPPASPELNLISFKNSRAVTISAAVAGAAFFISGIAAMLSPILWPVVLLAAGFFAVVAYKGRSSESISSAAGARLGWMTGLWLFLVLSLVATLITFYLSSPSGADTMKQLQAMPQFAQMTLTDSHELVRSMLISALPTFFMVTVIPGLGGILGARFWTNSKRSV